MRRAVGGILKAAVAILLVCAGASAQESDEKLAARVAKIDDKFLPALGDLAKKYDAEGNPEAAHFFAECALSFGKSDSDLSALKKRMETDLYVGKIRGGKVLADGKDIKAALEGVQVQYKKIFDEIAASAKAGAVPDARRRILHDCAVKYEVSHNTHQYIQATQRINELRRGMGLRAVLWDAEASKKLILAGCYMGDTGDYESKEWLGNKTGDAPQKDNIFWGDWVEFGKRETSRIPYAEMVSAIDGLRASALTREDILNLDARRLWLGRWSDGRKITAMTLYRVSPVGYREDVPTPSRRYFRETVTEELKTWVDTEDTHLANGKKIPYVRYPFSGEAEVPRQFDGEYGWADSEEKFLAKAGSPIMVRFFADCVLKEVEATLADKSGRNIPARVYRDGDKRVQFHIQRPTVLIVPEREFDKGMVCTISIRCKVDDTPFEKQWSFTTRAK
jgi:cytochrome c556